MKEQVYQIYDNQKRFLIWRKYYAMRLQQFRRYNFWMEIMIALGATGSGVAGFTVWQTNVGKGVWAGLVAASVVLSTVKPFLKLTDKVENYAKLYGSYTEICNKLNIMIEDLQVERSLSEAKLKTFQELRGRTAELAALEDPSPIESLVSSLQERVNKEIALLNLWVPEQ